MNAMDRETYQEIRDAWEQTDADDNALVGIMTGAGDRAFSAGADIKKVYAGEAGKQRAGTYWRHASLTDWTRWSETFPKKPWIAAVNGYCMAGGLEMALHCDMRIASENAIFGAPEVTVSALHGYGAIRLPGMIPAAIAMEMILTGRRLDAAEAYRVGLVSKVVPLDALMDAATEMALAVTRAAPLSVRATKELALRGQSMGFDDAQRYYAAIRNLLSYTEDQREGPMAFADKRPPEWRGR
jgi:enoyl-CoA hydratase/carnithine racemase